MNRFNYFACSQTQVCNYFDFSFMKVYLLNCKCSYVLDLLLWLFEGLMHWSPWYVCLHIWVNIHIYVLLVHTVIGTHLMLLHSWLHVFAPIQKKNIYIFSLLPLLLWTSKRCLRPDTRWDIRICLKGVILNNAHL